MGRKNKKKRRSFPASTVPTVDATRKPISDRTEKKKKPPQGQPIRETVESLAVAFILAFLFRTFQAEAFVIPTGSMAPTLMGVHKDLVCEESGQRFRVNASPEGKSVAELRQENRFPPGMPADQVRQQVQTVAGISPVCRYPVTLREGLPGRIKVPRASVDDTGTYSGDRILVNKYLYEFTEPTRWDVVVFRYPGNAQTNYIKRLVGLPNEELKIYQGDLFVRPSGSDKPHRIAPRPPSKLMAMRQEVHDTEHGSAKLHSAGWPAPWRDTRQAPGWRVTRRDEGRRAAFDFAINKTGQSRWLRYRHTPPPVRAWYALDSSKKDFDRLASNRPAQLVKDFNAFNTDITFAKAYEARGLTVDSTSLGLHWTGDLYIDAWVERCDAAGALTLELVEAGQHFQCVIDLASGDATLGIKRFETGEAIDGYGPSAKAVAPGDEPMRLRFANVDDQLLLWVNDRLIEFEASTRYDVDAVFGSREQVVPRTSKVDEGDLAPAAIGARDTSVEISRLQVWRDLYYIADTWDTQLRQEHFGANFPVTDWELTGPKRGGEYRVDSDDGPVSVASIAGNPAAWSAFSNRRSVEFTTGADQFFVMGDNSAQSSDSRLWQRRAPNGAQPGGAYLERSLLIGKAVCVYWPHSWFFPIPNVTDMRLVR